MLEEQSSAYIREADQNGVTGLTIFGNCYPFGSTHTACKNEQAPTIGGAPLLLRDHPVKASVLCSTY